MLNDHYPECRTLLPAINDIFPQFSRPISVLSPLDLSLRASTTIIPITPPTTPSPPRKRQRLLSDECNLWRPHANATTLLLPPPPPPPPLQHPPTAPSLVTSSDTAISMLDLTTTTTTATTTAAAVSTTSSLSSPTSTTTDGGNYFHHQHHHQHQHQHQHQHHHHHNVSYSNSNMSYRRDETATAMYKNNSNETTMNNFIEIPEIHSTITNQQGRTGEQRRPSGSVSTIYLDDETIVLTEDEEDETIVSSHDLTTDDDFSIGGCLEKTNFNENSSQKDDSDEEEYVDILSNDDDELNPQNIMSATLRLQSQVFTDEDDALEKSGKVLTRNKLVYDNEELHNRAIDGLAKLFELEFQPPPPPPQQQQQQQQHNKINDKQADEEDDTPISMSQEKIYTDLSNCTVTNGSLEIVGKPMEECQQYTTIPHVARTYKTERKRMKLRKNAHLDEETMSPVSGTIIRKLRDDEELVVRKGDIDPAFNVVEITEEAKAILASIDNKIGAYLCQLCRTLYDDAFMLAQHRCPRIVHIEYKCSECDKVFNCPANLASHRRWHKPKSELINSTVHNKKQLTTAVDKCQHRDYSPHEKTMNDDNSDGVFPCAQCGKTFRRHAYLKKHQASHQMLDNLQSLELFRNSNNSAMLNLQHATPTDQSNANFFLPTMPLQIRPNHNAMYATTNQQQTSITKPAYTQHRFGPLQFPQFDQRRFYSLGELYFSQHLDRTSAFQYVQANHLRNLTNANSTSNSFLPRPLVPNLMTTIPIK